jgi:predicted HicB family RNase H-like nuclease
MEMPMNTIKHGKYIATLELDLDAGIFHGEVVNLNDVVTFQGGSVGELRRAFKDSIEDYLKACVEFNKEPEKPFTGNFQVRLRPEVHRSAVIAAKVEGKSLNKWVAEKLEQAACGGHCLSQTQLIQDLSKIDF